MGATETENRLYGVIGEAADAAELLRLAALVRDRGFRRWDVFSPYPIHGMDAAMGLGRSPIGRIVLGGGVAGALTAVALQLYPSLIEYPQIVHGKPQNLFAAPAFFPILFELTVLFAAFACIIGMLVLNRLPRLHHPIFEAEGFERATDDGFFLVIEAGDPRFSERETVAWLEANGARKVRRLHEG